MITQKNEKKTTYYLALVLTKNDNLENLTVYTVKYGVSEPFTEMYGSKSNQLMTYAEKFQRLVRKIRISSGKIIWNLF